MSSGHILIAEGLIGAGKSSLVDSTLAHAEAVFGPGTELVVIKESVYFPFLDRCLKDPERMALPFQVCMARDRIETMRTAIRHCKQGRIVLIDRGLPGDIAFALHHVSQGNIDTADLGLYFGLLSHAVPRFVPPEMLKTVDVPDGAPSRIQVTGNVDLSGESDFDPDQMTVVYLRSSPQVAFERMKKRAIAEEVEGYTLGYFENLGRVYDKVIGTFSEAWGDDRVLLCDYDAPKELVDGLLSAEDCKAVWDRVVRK